jgi:hypothetical protein
MKKIETIAYRNEYYYSTTLTGLLEYINFIVLSNTQKQHHEDIRLNINMDKDCGAFSMVIDYPRDLTKKEKERLIKNKYNRLKPIFEGE